MTHSPALLLHFYQKPVVSVWCRCHIIFTYSLPLCTTLWFILSTFHHHITIILQKQVRIKGFSNFQSNCSEIRHTNAKNKKHLQHPPSFHFLKKGCYRYFSISAMQFYSILCTKETTFPHSAPPVPVFVHASHAR